MLYMNIKELSGYSSDPETICLKISGDDAGKFLQGQFSNDINLLEKDISQYSSYSTNQGKVIAILRILKDKDSYLILINKEISDYFIQKLSMYILMSKVTIEMTNEYHIIGICGQMSKELLSSYNAKNSSGIKEDDNYQILNNNSEYFSSSTLIYKDEAKEIDEIKKLLTKDQLAFNVNKLSDYYNRILRVTMETKEQYIPQVLNLEKLNGINYKKGCYTGQEIVARTHYLGKIKKQIFLINHNSKLINISNKIHDENNEILGEVISGNQTIQEEIICLAVIRLDAIEKDLYINNTKVNIVN
ncbi:MAG: folate-binding protein YgfZ [Gammaproteobacteria bacterium]|jgi:folate-binding protein YgfZ|tara:strand:+ start:2705 stop:3610 length:906 start_codon:yes stop_codon:yes gene_type:complete